MISLISLHTQLLTSSLEKFMWILLLWGVCNIGLFLFFFVQKKWKAFWLMNGLWGVINVCLSIFSLVKSGRTPLASELSQAISLFSNTRAFIAFSLALNVSYALIGFIMLREGQRVQRQRLKGFGIAIIVQGVFLLLFDSLLFFSVSHLSLQFFSSLS